MDRFNSRIAQVYGYAVCLITVVVMLISIKQVVDAAIDLTDPIRAGGGYGRMGRPITSFELYKAEARHPPDSRGGPMTTAAPVRAPGDTLSDAELRKLYDAEREQAIGSARFHSIRTLVGNLLLVVLAGILFGIHWRWLKDRDTTAAPA